MHGHAQQRTQHPRQNSLDMVKPAKSVLKGSPLASLLTSPNSADTSDNSPQPLHPHSVSPRVGASCTKCACYVRYSRLTDHSHNSRFKGGHSKETHFSLMCSQGSQTRVLASLGLLSVLLHLRTSCHHSCGCDHECIHC